MSASLDKLEKKRHKRRYNMALAYERGILTEHHHNILGFAEKADFEAGLACELLDERYYMLVQHHFIRAANEYEEFEQYLSQHPELRMDARVNRFMEAFDASMAKHSEYIVAGLQKNEEIARRALDNLLSDFSMLGKAEQ